MSNHNYHPPSTKSGFTLVEMLIIAPIVVLVIGVFISALVSMTGDVLVVRGSNALSYNIQDALNRIDLDVKTSGGYLATNDIALTSPQGFNNDTTVFHNADATNGTMLILKAYATTKNPIDPTKSYVYQSNQPKACSDQLVSQNSIETFDIVYFVKNVNGVNSLWRRVVAPSNYTTVGCSVPWQQPTCAAGYSAGFCLANDIKLVDGITSFGVNYYTSSDTVNPIADATNTSLADSVRQTAIVTARTVGITINATKKLAGRDVSKSGTIRTTSTVTNTVVLPYSASGGAITYVDSNGLNPRSSPSYAGGYTIHTFTTSGTFTVSGSSFNVETLVVGGGGGAGHNNGGGGGAGGVLTGSQTITGSMAVTVGSGGAPSTTDNPSGNNGENSVFGSLTAVGGGGGSGRGSGVVGGTGGSGGGGNGISGSAGGNGVAGQGYAGAAGYTAAQGDNDGGGGGGGAGEAGARAIPGFFGGIGGDGVQSSITGTATYYGGGGGGAEFYPAAGGLGGGGAASTGEATAGTPNTGGGGGATESVTAGYSKAGGSGVVIIRYLTP